MTGGTGRLAVLSYHSWETTPESLVRDVRQLRADGWRAATLSELLTRSDSGDRFLVTSDDGHPEDEPFFDALAAASCVGVSFVNVGRMPMERRVWYRARAAAGALVVEDHGQWHRRHFMSSRVTGWMDASSPREDVAHLGLEAGSPLCALAGEVAAPRFFPDAEIAAVVSALARVHSGEIGDARWAARAERELTSRGLAYRRFGHLCLRGRFETTEEFHSRADAYVRDGQRAFEEAFGVAPRFYAYTWWQGSAAVDAILQRAGYAGSFWGRDRLPRGVGATFGIPRLEVSPRVGRPLRPERYPRRRTVSVRPIEAARGVAKRLLGVR